MVLRAGHCRPSPSPAPVVRSRRAAACVRLLPGSSLFGALQFTVMCVAADFFLLGLLYVPLFSDADFHLSLLLENCGSSPILLPFRSTQSLMLGNFFLFLSSLGL